MKNILKLIRTGFLISLISLPILMFAVGNIIQGPVDSWVEDTCDYANSGYSGCEDSKLFTNMLISLPISIVILLLFRANFPKTGRLRDYIVGIVYFILTPFVNIFIAAEVPDYLRIYGDERGEFNDKFIPFLIVVNIIILSLLTFPGVVRILFPKKLPG